jgi:hypothetical protein
MAVTLVSGSRGHGSVRTRAALLFALAIFAVLSLFATLGAALNSHPFLGLDPDATTDDFLRILDVPHPAARLTEALRAYPPDQPLLYVGQSRDAFNTQVYYTLAYLAYPRPLSALMCAEPGKGRVAIAENAPRTAEAGILFFGVDPGPRAAGGTRISPNLYISPRTGAAPWPSFCP